MGLAQINIRFKANMEELSSQMQNISRDLKKRGEEMQNVGKQLSTAVTLPLVALGTAATKFASDLEQSISKTDVVFGKQSESVKQFAQSTLNAFGISESAALDMLSLYGDMGTSMGITQGKAAEMSKKLVGLAGDLASFKNIGLDQAQTALNGIFSGETESLKMLGVIMTDANLQQYAYTQGISKKISAMTQDEKVMLRYNFVLSQTKNAHGDFQKEIGSAANQSRVFTEGLKELGAQFGQVILPYFTKAVTALNGFMRQISATDSEQKKWIVGIAAIGAAVGPVLVVFGTLMASVPNIVNGFKAIRVAVLAMNTAFLANPITAVVAVLAALTAGFVLAESRLKPLVNAQKELNETTQKATQSVTAEIAETRRLVAIAQNKKLSDEERTRALNQLIQKSSEHFGKLTLETIGTDKAKKATDAYTNSLIQNARVKAAQDKLVEIQKRKIDLELGASNEADPSVWQTIGSYGKSIVKGGFGNAAIGNTLFDLEQSKSKSENTKIATAELSKLEDQLTAIIGPQKAVTETVNDYTDATNNASGATSGLKKVVEDLGAVGSEKWMQAQISAMQEQKSKLDVSSEAYASLNNQIKIYQNTLEGIKGTFEHVSEGSVYWYTNEIQQMENLLQKLDMSSEAYSALENQIKIYQNTLDMTSGKTEANSLKWYQNQISELETIREGLDYTSRKFEEVSAKINKLKTTFTVVKKIVEAKGKGEEPEFDTVGWYDKQRAEINDQISDPKTKLEDVKRLKQELSVLNATFDIQVNGLDTLDALNDKIDTTKLLANGAQQAISAAFGAMADSLIGDLDDSRSALERFGKSLLMNTIKAIGTALAQATANAILAASGDAQKMPFGTFLMPALIGGAVASVASAFASIPKFADGGIVSGPTLGLMGEYAGAANNPEVIAPLNKLKELIAPATNDQPINIILQGGWNVTGEQIQLALDRYQGRKFRTG